MHSATAYVIRDVRPEDVPELVRLGWATEVPVPAKDLEQPTTCKMQRPK